MRKNEGKYSALSTVKRMLHIMKRERKDLIGKVVVYTIAAGFYPFMGILLPKVAIGTIENYGENAVKPLIGAMLVFFLVAAVLAMVSQTLKQTMQLVCMRVRLRYLAWMSGKIQNMEYRYVEDSHFQEKYDKAFQACNNNADGVEGVYNRLCIFPAKLLSAVIMMVLVCFLNPLILIALVLHTAATIWGLNKAHNYRYSQKENMARAERKMKYYKNTANDFSFGKDIRIFNMRDRIVSNYKNEIQALNGLKCSVMKKEWLYSLLGTFTMLLSNALLYGLLIYYCLKGMPISSFTMYVFMVSSLMAMLVEIGQDISFIRNQGQYVDDYFKFIDAVLVEEGTVSELPDKIEIRFENMSFKYPGTEKYIYKDFNFTIKAGEKLAIVGVNGAGKTTLVKLICGLYQPTSGHIYINDIDICSYKKETLYKMFGTVFQDFSVLAYTVKENVAAESEGIDENRVNLALESVGLKEKIEQLPKGIDTMMLKIVDEEGMDLSGGQRQKLAIARALYKDAPMVIMDEPTAALDALAEADIYQNFSSLVEGKTAVYISHRLASTRFCDQIVLLDADGIKEYGTHDELMAKKGAYYEMFMVQGKYYKEQSGDMSR